MEVAFADGAGCDAALSAHVANPAPSCASAPKLAGRGSASCKPPHYRQVCAHSSLAQVAVRGYRRPVLFRRGHRTCEPLMVQHEPLRRIYARPDAPSAFALVAYGTSKGPETLSRAGLACRKRNLACWRRSASRRHRRQQHHLCRQSLHLQGNRTPASFFRWSFLRLFARRQLERLRRLRLPRRLNNAGCARFGQRYLRGGPAHPMECRD